MAKLLASLLMALLFVAAQAKEAVPVAADPVLETRLNKLAETLRCLVCQNQSIADSHAELAIDLKNQVREMMVRGQTDEEIVAYMVQRYGDFVLFRPPLKPTTALLWFGPLLLFLIGFAALGYRIARQRRRGSDPALDEEARVRLRFLVATTEKDAT